MADVVRLSIVYDTSQAAAQLTALNQRGSQLTNTTNKLGNAAVVGGSRLRGMALAGTKLAASLSAGDISAKSLVGAVGRLAGPTGFAALVVSILSVVGAIEEYQRIVKDVEDTIGAMGAASKDAADDVRRLLGETPQESNAEKAVKRLRDAIAQIRKEAARLGGPAGVELEKQARGLEQQIPSVAGRARAQAAREVAKSLADYNRQLVRQNQLLNLLNAGPLEQLEATLALSTKRLEHLVDAGRGATVEAELLAASIQIGTKRLADMRRAAGLMTSGLTMLADTIEQFVIDGTASFTEFLNNILRLLYRDAADSLISGIVNSYVKKQAGGSIGGGTDVTGDVPAAPLGSVTSNVTFQINTIDAQGVAAFIEGNGAQIAATVAGYADRSRAIRRKMSRG
jgi:Lambda phage tail tape-measure protein (Tape_meas_lam_C)